MKKWSAIMAMVMALLVVAVVGVAAALYPVSVALKVQPVQAMQTE